MNYSLGSLLLALSLVLSACGTTPPSKYYLLSAEASRVPSGFSPALGVGPIEIPEYLNRNAMVYGRDGNKLHIASFERWAEPLDSGISRVVRLNLASLLNTQNVQSYPWSKNEQPGYGIEVTVLGLDASDVGARLVAEWRIYKPGSKQTVVRKISELNYDLPPGSVTASEISSAYSSLLLQLSETIAAAISADVERQADNATGK